MKRLTRLLVAPLRAPGFLYILVLAVAGGVVPALLGRGWLLSLCLAVLVAYVAGVCFLLWRRVCGGRRRCGNALFVAAAVVGNVLLAADAFMYATFGQKITPSGLAIIAGTNAGEATAFLSVYMSPLKALGLLALLLGVNAAALFAQRRVRLGRMALVALLLLAAGAIHHAAMAVIAWHGSYADMSGIERLVDMAGRGTGCREGRDATFVLVIGESHAAGHSQLYGYRLPTSPLLASRVADGEVVVFENAVSTADHTHAAMHSIFSVGTRAASFYDVPLLPMLFKDAGYSTALYDNIFLADGSLNFMSHKVLSDKMYDERNAILYTFDGDMLDALPAPHGRQFAIYHLMGQHYTYADRYPHTSRFCRFTTADYSAGSETQRRTMAAYDNACVYNDYVLDRIIASLADSTACVVYLSDHGEDLYDQGDAIGHGFASSLPSMRYQLHVPLLVWASARFRTGYPELWQRIAAAAGRRVSTDDIPHLLLDIAGLRTRWFDPARSPISESYDTLRKRIVLDAVDYDRHESPIRAASAPAPAFQSQKQ